MTDPQNRRTFHFQLRVPFIRVGFFVGNTALEIAEAEHEARWRSSFGEAISEAAKVLAGVLVKQHGEASGAKRGHVYRVSVPPAWAKAHPEAFLRLQCVFAPVAVDDLTTCVDLATLWQDGQASACEALTDDGLPEHVVNDWYVRSR